MTTFKDQKRISKIKEILECETRSPSEQFVNFLLSQAELTDLEPIARLECVDMVREAVQEFARERALSRAERVRAGGRRLESDLERAAFEPWNKPSDYYLG